MKENWECGNSLVIDGHDTILAENTKGSKALINWNDDLYNEVWSRNIGLWSSLKGWGQKFLKDSL